MNAIRQEIFNRANRSIVQAIDYVESLLAPNSKISDFYQEQSQKYPKLTCNFFTESSGLLIKCKTCNEKSFICFSCFINGNHEGHDYYMIYSQHSCCNCGSAFSPFNSNYHCNIHNHKEVHENPDIEFLSPEEISLWSDIFDSFNQILSRILSQNAAIVQVQLILHWLMHAVSLNDPIKRCYVKSFLSHLDFNIIYHFSPSPSTVSQSVVNFISLLKNDSMFAAAMNKFHIEQLSFLTQSILSSSDFTDAFSLINSSLSPHILDTYNLFQDFSCFTNIINSMNFFFTKFLTPVHNLDAQLFPISLVKSLFKGILRQYDPSNQTQSSQLTSFISTLSKLYMNFEFSLAFIREIDEKSDIPEDFKFYCDNINLVNTFSYCFRKCPSLIPLQVLRDLVYQHPLLDTRIYVGEVELAQQSPLIENIRISPCISLHILAWNAIPLDQPIPQTLADLISPNPILDQSNSQNSSQISSKESSTEQSKEPSKDQSKESSKDQSKETANENSADQESKNDQPVNRLVDLITRLLHGPSMIYASSRMNYLHLFIRNDDQIIQSLYDFAAPENLKSTFIPTFAFIQALMGSSPIPEITIQSIILKFSSLRANIFPIPTQVFYNTFDMVFNLCCFIFDRTCLTRDYLTMKKETIISHLTKGSATFDELNKCFHFSSHIKHDTQLMEELKTFTTKINTNDGTRLRLNAGVKWNPLLPWLPTDLTLELISTYLSKNPNSLIPFPDFTPAPYGLNFLGYLFSPTLFAIEYYFLLEFYLQNFVQIPVDHPTPEILTPELMQLIYNLLIQQNKLIDETDHHFIDLINTDISIDVPTLLDFQTYYSIQTLSKGLQDFFESKSFTNPSNQFIIFIHSKILAEVTSFSLLDLLGKIGGPALIVLEKLGYSNLPSDIQKEVETEQAEREQRRAKVRALKASILADFQSKASNFSSELDKKESVSNTPEAPPETPSETLSEAHSSSASQTIDIATQTLKHPLMKEDSSIITCSVCFDSDPDFMCYPVYAYSTILPHSLIYKQNDPRKMLTSFKLCDHPCHPSCLSMDEDTFNCPVCRAKRNAFLPINPSFSNQHYIQNFLLLSNFQYPEFTDLFPSVAGELILLETRSRYSYECLSPSSTSVLLLKTLFKDISYGLQTGLIPPSTITPKPRILSILSHLLYQEACEYTFDLDFFYLNPETVHQTKEELIQEFYNRVALSSVWIVQFPSSSLKDQVGVDLLRFLRCCALFEHLILGHSLSVGDIDWDYSFLPDVLISHFLLQSAYYDDASQVLSVPPHFDFSEASVHIKQFFTTIEREFQPHSIPQYLVSNFLDYFKEPYSYPIDKPNPIFLDIFTGEAYIHNRGIDNYPEQLRDLDMYLSSVQSGFNVFLILNGFNASSVVLFEWEQHLTASEEILQYRYFRLKTFYVDAFNDSDEGLVHGSLLHLNQNLFYSLVEKVLSGDWNNDSFPGIPHYVNFHDFGLDRSIYHDNFLNGIERRDFPEMVRRIMIDMAREQMNGFDDSDNLFDDDDDDDDFEGGIFYNMFDDDDSEDDESDLSDDDSEDDEIEDDVNNAAE